MSATPARLIFPPQRLSVVDAYREWQRRLAEAGFAAPIWPEEYGGLGMAPGGQLIVAQELERARPEPSTSSVSR